MSEVKETLKNAIRYLSNKHNISLAELRIKISKPEKQMVYEIMKNKEVIDKTNVATALNLGAIKAMFVAMKLETMHKDLSLLYNVPLSRMNVRIYTKTDDCEPLLYLYDGGTPKIKLLEEDIAELV